MTKMFVSMVLTVIFTLAPLTTNLEYTTVPSDEVYVSFVSLNYICELSEGKLSYVFWESQVSIIDEDALACIAQFNADDEDVISQIGGEYYVRLDALKDKWAKFSPYIRHDKWMELMSPSIGVGAGNGVIVSP